MLILAQNVVQNAPNLHRLKLNLPFQVVGQLCTTATLLLATTFSTLAERPEEHKELETLVLDHVSDTTINAISNNHIDLTNAIRAFSSLKNLVLSVKRQEVGTARQKLFAKHLWFLIRKAVSLESLCLIGWNVKRSIVTRRHYNSISFGDWMMRSLPYTIDSTAKLTSLRYLELKRVDIEPQMLLQMISECSATLKEVYLSEVFIKVFGASDGINTPLWIGHPNMPQPEDCCWLAADLRKIESLKLDILRVTCLGYDDYEPDPDSLNPDYDLNDPTDQDRSFDQRFVDAVFGISDTVPQDVQYEAAEPLTKSASSDSISTEPSSSESRPRSTYDAETYQRDTNNPTSHYKRCIDGYFFNHNERALRELQNIITVADRGMNIISEEINRSRRFEINDI